MNKVIELAIEADSATGFHIACIEAQKIKPFLERFYALSRADLEAENEQLRKERQAFKDVAEYQKAENAKLKEHLRWALSNINCEPFEWSDEENADAHEAARAALGENE